jgi:hypothetical protein
MRALKLANASGRPAPASVSGAVATRSPHYGWMTTFMLSGSMDFTRRLYKLGWHLTTRLVVIAYWAVV